MSIEENKSLVYRYFEAINNKNVTALLELCDENIIEHPTPKGLPPGIDGIKAHKEFFISAIPDAHVTVDDVFCEGNKVALRFTLHGTDVKTGKPYMLQAMGIGYIVNGKFAELWQGNIEESEG